MFFNQIWIFISFNRIWMSGRETSRRETRGRETRGSWNDGDERPGTSGRGTSGRDMSRRGGRETRGTRDERTDEGMRDKRMKDERTKDEGGVRRCGQETSWWETRRGWDQGSWRYRWLMITIIYILNFILRYLCHRLWFAVFIVVFVDFSLARLLFRAFKLIAWKKHAQPTRSDENKRRVRFENLKLG